MSRIGVLALQGAVEEHLQALRALGQEAIPVKNPAELEKCAGLIIPGGESTAISRLIDGTGLREPIRAFAASGQVFGTCAGLILCCSELSGPEGEVRPLELLDARAVRNGFGRQVDSFETLLTVNGFEQPIPAVFIRAPYIEKTGENVRVRAKIGKAIVMAESEHVLVTAFHPELTDDLRILEYFCSRVRD